MYHHLFKQSRMVSSTLEYNGAIQNTRKRLQGKQNVTMTNVDMCMCPQMPPDTYFPTHTVL